MLEKLPESLGHALQHRRAGLHNLLYNKLATGACPQPLNLSSPAFADSGALPARFTSDGDGISPPLHWQNVPPATTCLVLIVEDADSPTSEPLVHAIAVLQDPQRTELAEGELNEVRDPAVLHVGRNSYLRRSWLPPDPPRGHGVHRYAFQLFALRPGQPLSTSPGRGELTEVIRSRAICGDCLIGTYERAASSGSTPSG